MKREIEGGNKKREREGTGEGRKRRRKEGAWGGDKREGRRREGKKHVPSCILSSLEQHVLGMGNRYQTFRHHNILTDINGAQLG